MALQNLNIDPFDNNSVYEANYQSESKTIPASPNYPYNATVKDRYIVQLLYVPYIADGYAFSISGYTRWESGTFTTGQFKVIAYQDSPDNLSNLVEFHPDDAGNSVTIDYYHIGTQLTKEILESELALKMDKSQNLDDVSNKSTARTNLDVYSKSETDNKYVELSGDTMTGQLKVQYGGITSILGADNNASTLTNDTTKGVRLAMPHYKTSEEQIALIYGIGSTANSIIIGGGTSDLNAATSVSIYTAANYNTTTGTKRFEIDKDGKVYMDSITGTSAAGQVLEYNTGSKEVYYETSSERYKENITYNIDTSKLYKLKVCKFDRKDKSSKNEIGLIAEDVAKVIPEIVCLNQEGQVEAYNKMKLIPYLVNEIQILKKEIEKLKMELNK